MNLSGGMMDTYDWMMSKSDPRSAEWPLMKSPFPVFSILISYIYFVKVWGPKFMKNREPFQLQSLIIVYNIVMVLLSTFFFIVGGSLTYFGGGYNLICEPVDYSHRPKAMKILTLGWWFLLLKIVELIDTVFFVLRKKFTHISALHVTHHSLVLWSCWLGMKFGGGGHTSFFPLINCFIHMIMYTYYCLAALGPNVRKYLWWKRYLTIMQMTQFVVALIHGCLPLIVDCGYQPFIAYIVIGQAVIFWVMFYNFYNTSYNNGLINNNNQKLKTAVPMLSSTSTGNTVTTADMMCRKRLSQTNGA